MKLALGQVDCEPGDVKTNTQQLVELTRQAADAGNDVVIFPEMSHLGLHKQIAESATSWSDGPFPALATAAKECHIHVITGLVEREGNDLYNTLAVIGNDGELLTKYRKIHLINLEAFLEREYFAPGNELALCELGGIKCGFMTCYDIRFPELARALTKRGAELLIAPAAFPLVRMEHWKAITTCRAIENQAYVAAANRTGTDRGFAFGGSSRVVDPYGLPVATMSEVDTGLITAEISKQRVSEVRGRMKVLEDCREDLYRTWLSA